MYSNSIDIFYPGEDAWILEVGVQGLPGSGSTGASKVPFSYGDASPKIVGSVSAGKSLKRCAVSVRSPFNIPVPMSLGVAGSLGLFMPVGSINGMAIAVFESNPDYSPMVGTDILLAIGSSGGVDRGGGVVYLEII